mmetsp:Transcript_28675/g.51056  ORF Transcript_28675/g.51056 Transcript_28675/m.51056 type:complete len:126 (+) Transcript_28675:2117-2494(+)
MEDILIKHRSALVEEYQAVFNALEPNIKELHANVYAGAANCFRKEGTELEIQECAKVHLTKIADLFKRADDIIGDLQRKFDNCSNRCKGVSDEIKAYDSCVWDCKQFCMKDSNSIKAEMERLARR